MIRIRLCFVLWFLGLSYSQAQFTTEGKEFWVGFMSTSFLLAQQELFITSSYNTTGTVEVPSLGWSHHFVVTASQTTVISLPPIGAKHSEIIENKGVHVASQDNISLYAVTKAFALTEATVILPISSLTYATSYTVMSMKAMPTEGGKFLSQFMVVAMEDDTQLTIIPSALTQKNHPKNVPYHVLLQKGQTYTVKDSTRSSLERGDLTGSVITSNGKPFALFSGAELALVGQNLCAAGQHLYEQNYPTNTWGREYILIPHKLANWGYVYRVLASTDNTTIKIYLPNNTVQTINLQKGAFYEGDINLFLAFQKGIYIKSDKPICIGQFMKGAECNGIRQALGVDIAKGDPHMLLLNPNNQTVKKAIFNTVSTPNDAMIFHYLNILVRTSDVGTIKLNGAFLNPNQFIPVETFVGYSYAQIDLVPYGIDPVLGKSFTIESDNPFIAYVYGFGDSSSYGYSVGANFEIIDYDFTASSQAVCLGDAITFTGSGTNISSYTWYFGDGSPTQTGKSVTHTFQQAGKYEVKMMVTIPNNFNQHQVVYEYEVYDTPRPNLGMDKIVCIGTHVLLDAGVQGVGWQYEWHKDGNIIIGQTTKFLPIEEAGIYQVTVKTPKNCIGTDETEVAHFPVVDAQIIGLEEKYAFQTQAIPLQGLPTGGFFTINQVPATAIIPRLLGLGNFMVVYTYTDVHGCVSRDTAQFSIFNPLTIFEVPNSFTPNGDGLNDELRVFGDNFVGLDMRIYNRWGEIVFMSNSQFNTWNGSVNGKPAPAGIYAYTIRYQEKFTKIWHTKQGYIQVIR